MDLISVRGFRVENHKTRFQGLVVKVDGEGGADHKEVPFDLALRAKDILGSGFRFQGLGFRVQRSGSMA